VIVDDIILTTYNQAAQRVRDAIIVSKAWRDGASPKDARTASSLMSSDAVHCIRRVARSNCNSTSSQRSVSSESFCCRSISSGKYPYQLLYSWEKVLWIDDTEFSLLRCPSLGPRSMRGFEMFTVGDCQSILLKLTNERCEELREALQRAISRQIFAEQSLRQERDVDDDSGLDSFMTNAETVYLEAMEDVKVTTKDLADAERAFNMVRDKIEKLVIKYETLLEKIEDEDTVISLKSNISTGHDDNYGTDAIEDHRAEKEKLTRRAQRAELKAEVAVQEAEKSKQEAEAIKYEKQEELETLQKKLEDLETKSAHMANEFEMKLNHRKLWANSMGNGSGCSQNSKPLTSGSTLVSATGTHSLLYAASHVGLDQEKINAKVRIKERFRQRNSQKLTGQVHQRLEFYERSLQAVRN